MRTIIPEEQLTQGIRRLAEKIRANYENRPLTVIGVLIESISILADLMRLLDMPLRVELIQTKCPRIGTQRPGPLALDAEMLSLHVRGRDVLLVDDIFDTGHTLWELIPQIDELGPLSVRTAVLLRKQGRCRYQFQPDFVAFDIPDGFVVGHGLGYNDKYRSLPYIAALDPGDMDPAQG